MAAVVMLRICVIKDKTVLFICIPALIASADFINGNFNSWSMISVLSFMAFAISGKVNMGSLPVLNIFCKSILYGLDIFIGTRSLGD